MAKRSEAFGFALRRVREALGLPQDVFGARVGVSRRTLTRWEVYGELPPIGQRKHIATSFPDAPVELRAALVQSLRLGDGFLVSFDRPAPGPTTLQQAAEVDSAFLELCEGADVAPGRLRAGLVGFLCRVEASGLSIAATRVQLEPKAKPKAKTKA